MNSLFSTIHHYITRNKRRSGVLAILFFCVALIGIALAQSGPSISTSFTPADPARTWMDIGGVWNGATEVTNTTGDTFGLTITNPSGNATTMYNVRPSITLPAGFKYVSASVTGPAGITASQSGATLTFTLTSATRDIAVGSSRSITYGLYADSTVGAGTYAIANNVLYKNTSSGADQPALTSSQGVVVQKGATVIQKSPYDQTRAVNNVAEWDVTVTNHGLGGLFDVPINESAINPGSALQIQSITSVSSTTSSKNGSGSSSVDTLTVKYLPAGASFTAHVTALVTACGDIKNTASTTDRTLATAKSTFASVTLDLQAPLIDFTPPTTPLNYNATKQIVIPIKNTGLGDATEFVLQSNLPSLNIAVSTVATGWTYNAVSGDFKLTASNGLIANNATKTLTFNAKTAAGCPVNIGGIAIWKAQYQNPCGNFYLAPTKTSTISQPIDQPNINLAKSASPNRLNVGETGSYTLSLSASNASNFQTGSDGNVVVTDTLPTSGLTNITIGTPTVGSTTFDTNTNLLTWTIPRANVVANQTLKINFTVDQTDPCLGGTSINNTALATVKTKTNCTLTSSSSANILIANTPGVTLAQQNFNVALAPNGSYETGNSSAPGQGELIPITASYEFGAGAGTFTGSTYVDNFGGLVHQTLVPGSLQVKVNGNSVPVTLGSVTQSTGTLNIKLDFLSGINGGNIANQKIEFSYKTTVPDSDLGASSSRGVTQMVTFTVGGAGTAGGACGIDNSFKMGDTFSISRAEAEISVSMPSTIEKCQTFPVTLTVRNGINQQAQKVLTTFLTSGAYSYPTGQTPTYGGVFAGNITYAENSGTNPTFTYTGSKLTGNGTITFNVRLRDSANTTPASLSAKVDFDDNQTAATLTRDFSNTGSATPSLVRQGILQLTVSPNSVNIIGNTAQWTIYVTNTGDGTAFNSELKVNVPAGLDSNKPRTDILNASNPVVTVSGQHMTWNLGDIASGGSKAIKVSVDVDASSCVDIKGLATIKATWGCNGGLSQTVTVDTPKFSFATGQLQVLHDTINSYFELCKNGYIVIIVKNVGLPHLYNVKINENLGAGSGIAFVPGTVQYSVNQGAYNTVSSSYNPTGSGPYQWTKTQIPALADLSPVSEGSGTNEVRIRFQISSTPAVNANPILPQITASGSGDLICGNTIQDISGGVAFKLPAKRPEITLVKEGANLTEQNKTASTATYAKTVYGGVGDQVAWRIRITNNGQKDAESVNLKDILPPGNNPTSVTITGPGAGAFTGGVDMPISNIAIGNTAIYYITETLGNVCVNADNKASVTWNCPSNPVSPPYSSPTKNSDTAQLVMKPDIGVVDLTQQFTTSGSSARYNNGRVRGRVTITNNGGPATKISLPMTLLASMDLDQTVAPAITTNTTTGAHKITSVTVSPTDTHPNYTFTFNSDGWLRNSESVTVTYYLVQRANFDILANGSTPLSASDPSSFKYPESTNGLDSGLPPTGNVVAKVEFESTCGTTGTPVTKSNSVDPLTPNLDITVANVTQTTQTGQSYKFNFYYTITNNGDTNSVADHIIFSLPYVGTTFSTTLITGPNGESDATSITLTNSISKGNSVVVLVHAETKVVPVDYDLRLIGQVEGSTFKQDETTKVGNYSLDRAAPVNTSDVNVSGYVYLDNNFNAQRETSENGTGITLYAKLIPVGGAPAIAVVPVNSSTGAYLFTNVSDTVSPYEIVINGDNNPSNIAPLTPGVSILQEYIGTEAPTLKRTNVIVGSTNVMDQNFGLFHGSSLSGTVFKDDGITAGTANDGIKNINESGLSGVNIKVTNAGGGTTYATATTDPNGSYTVYIPYTAGNNPLKVVETNLTGYTSTGADVGTTTGTGYNRGADAITFTNTVGKKYTGVDFGDVPSSTLIIDGNKTLAPGGTVFFPHVFTAGTAGNVTFSVTNTVSPTQTGWTHTLYLDTNENGVLDPGELPITTSVPVAAGGSVHLLILEFAPANATNGAQDTLYIKAQLVYANATNPTITETLMRSDIATVSRQPELKLQKEVDKANAKSGDNLTYTITYKNNSAEPLTNLIVNDSVPAFTTFVSAAFGTTPSGIAEGTIIEPTVGAAGNIQWPFGGSLAPGQTGTVTFVVKVQ